MTTCNTTLSGLVLCMKVRNGREDMGGSLTLLADIAARDSGGLMNQVISTRLH